MKYATISVTLLLMTFNCCLGEQGIFENLGQVGNKMFFKSATSESIWGASSGCRAEGMEVASIESAEENAFLLSHSSIGLFVSYWTSALVINTGADMTWHYSGTPVDTTFMEIPGSYITAGVIFNRLNRNWRLITIYSGIGETRHPYLCEAVVGRKIGAGNMKLKAAATTRSAGRIIVESGTTLGVLDLQPLGQVGNKEYHVDLTSQLTWNESLHTCQGLGMQLAEILNVEEMDFLKGHPLLEQWHRFWVAARVFTYPTDLTWGNGNPIDYTLGQMDPTDLYHRNSLTYVGVEGDGYFEPESTRRPFLCQKIVAKVK